MQKSSFIPEPKCFCISFMAFPFHFVSVSQSWVEHLELPPIVAQLSNFPSTPFFLLGCVYLCCHLPCTFDGWVLNFFWWGIKTCGHQFSGCFAVFSANLRKHGTSTIEFGRKPGEIKEKPPKSTLAFNWGSNSKTHHFLCSTEFHPGLTSSSPFLEASTAVGCIFVTPHVQLP